MKFSSLAIIAAAAVAAAEPAVMQNLDSPLEYVEAATTVADAPIAHAAATPTAELFALDVSPNMSSFEYDRMPNALKQFICDMSPKSHLELRQNAPVGGGQGAAASPTQLSPTTIYNIGAGEETYTQTFKTPPSQLPSPSTGSIGLGSIQGQVGKVRTYSSNPAPTAHVDSRVMLAVAGGIGAGMIL